MRSWQIKGIHAHVVTFYSSTTTARLPCARRAAKIRMRAKKADKANLAERIEAFQFRDIRPKAASDITSLEDASKLLGHTHKQITQKVYRRVGEVVKPTK